jgi:hypothetical protein
MKNVLRLCLLLAGGFVAMGSAHANIIITEVDPSSSGNGAVGSDWFELTNTGSTAVDITGWKMDDSSSLFGSAVTLNGITSIAAGQSVIFAESSTPATAQSKFLANWFTALHPAPANFAFGTYTGSGVGLSTDGDGVSIFNATGTLIASVSFGSAGDQNAAFVNPAGGNNVMLNTFAVVGVNGAYAGVDNRVASPGTYAAPVPLPAGVCLLTSGLGLLGGAVRRRRAAA